MVLSDRDIKAAITSGEINIEPFSPECIQPTSVDVRLASKALIWRQRYEGSYISPTQPVEAKMMGEWNLDFPELLYPYDLLLASTLEKITLNDSIVARIEGKSSLARLGIAVHVTGGFIDCGWSGNITLEIVNFNPNAVILHTGMKIAQISFMRLSSPAERPYGSPGLGSKYTGQNAIGVVGSLYHENF